MSAWAWTLIAIAAVVVAGLVVWQIAARRRTSHLQETFGAEYDRVTSESESRRAAEAELARREERRAELEIRPLSEASRERFVESWSAVQTQFVDDPRTAVASADSLVQSVMAERGYPVDDFEQRAADISVDHPHVVENYREGHRLAETSRTDGGSTEELRQALQHYRALFEELVERVPEQARA
jgi:hypothetical protein